MRLFGCVFLFAAACGHIEYGDGPTPPEVAAASSGSAVTLAGPPPPPAVVAQPPVSGPRVVFVPWEPGARPLARPMNPPASPRRGPAAPRDGVVRCGSAEYIRIDNRIIDGGGGPAVVAEGSCRVEVTESILRGDPAVVVRGRAHVRLSESRIDGDLETVGVATIATRGCRHERGRRISY